MAFTQKEISAAFNDPMYSYFSSDLPRLQQSHNYPIIMDFLTGKSNSLQGIVPDEFDGHWRALMPFLENATTLGPREKLLLELAADPVLNLYLDYHINTWLISYVFNNTTDKAFKEALQIFRKTGKSDDEIFMVLTQYLNDEPADDFEIPSIPFYEFLKDQVKKHRVLMIPGQGKFYSSQYWKPIYFMLLDQARPEFATEYALGAVKADYENIIPGLGKYKQGKYLPAIEQFISSECATLEETLQRFHAAIQLYQLNARKYKQLLVLAHKALELFNAAPADDRYAHGYRIEELETDFAMYLAPGAVAFHFILKLDNENALPFIGSWMEQKKYVPFHTLYVLHHHLGDNAWPYIEKFFENDEGKTGIDHYRVIFDFIQKSFAPSLYVPMVWKMVSSKSKPMRHQVAKIIAAADADAEKKAIELLNDKNAESRITAALILGYSASTAAKEAVLNVLNKETNDNARDLLLQIAVDSLPREADMNFVNAMVDAAQKRGKLNKPVHTWLNESDLPPLYFSNGEQVPLPFTRFLLYRMSRTKEMRSDPEARYLIQHLDKERSAPFAFELISIFKNKDAKPEFKYLMLTAALLGSDSVVDKIRLTINKWIEDNRTKMAEHGIGALSLQGSDKALRWVEWYSRKYKSNKAKIGAAALEALENAAEELGISTHDLGDRIVPNFDFDGLFKHFTVNGDEYRAFIDSNFKIAFFNEDNKKIKSIPPAADAGLKDEFKAIAKEVRDIVKSQSPRLEYYLIIQRRWTFEKWQQFFLQNPIMFIYATKLLWGVYDSDGKIAQTFMCNDDTTLVDVNQDEISLQEAKAIGIVHPSQLSAELLQQWKQVFFDSNVESIFPQLDRAMPDMTNIDLSKKIITKFVGKKMKEGSTRSTLERFGWFRGPVGDGGMLESINLKYPEKKLEAVLEVEGIGVGYGWGGDDTLGRFYILDTSTNVKQQFTSFQDDDERLATLASVPGIFLREALAAIEAIKPLEKIT